MAKHQMISFAASSFSSTSSSSSSSSSSVVSLKKYDVFLSFRGEDTRSNFTSHLYDALRQKKVETYIDYQLEKGDEIGPELIKAIEGSHISVVIFSENYASSKWCLDEISKILECKKDHGQVVIPVFYNIDPSHVRKQTGSYEQAFKKHELDTKHNKDKVHKWKAALIETASVVGWDSRTYRTEVDLIKQIVEHILKRLKHIYMSQHNPKVLVGIHEQVAILESLVALEPEVVRVIGIWGIGGIGKTTIATKLYERLCFEYEACCFMHNVSENLQKYGVTRLQNELFCSLLEEKDPSISISIVRCKYNMTRLRRKKVFLVLDDVDDLMKVRNLYGGHDWFGNGSRVIVTSRDSKVLTNLVDNIYEVKALEFKYSLQLFILHAFKEYYPKMEWMDLLVKAVNYAEGIPLAIEVLGSSLYGKKKRVWESQLKKLKKMPLPAIQNVLRLSYDGLDREEQDIFLYLACFFIDHEFNIFLLDACGYSTDVGLATLRNKALVSIYNDLCSEVQHCNWTMLDLIREMGKEVVCGESRDPGKRRHLWDPHDVYQVLENATGTGAIQSLTLIMRRDSKELCLSPKAFNRMFNLKLLKLHTTKIIAPKDSISLPKGLRLLEWWGCPLKTLGSSFCAENLVELDLSYSNLERLWDGVQNLVKLKSISLEKCEQLMELPDFSKALNIEYVDLSYCTRLIDLHPSILSLHNLQQLDLYGCKKLHSLRNDHQLKSLSFISAWCCTSLKEFSIMSESLEELYLTNTGIVEVNSLGFPLNKLEYLKCDFSKSLPHNFLQVLDLEELRKVTLDFFDPKYFLKSLKCLYLSGSNIEYLPSSINQLSMLKELTLYNCKRLQYIPALPPSIDVLDVRSCISLEGVSISTVDYCWHSEAYFSFWNCCKLNQQALNTIMSFSHAKMKGAAYIQHLQPNEWSGKNKKVCVCLPGSKVPADKYDYRTTTKFTMSIQLPNLSNLMGLSFCVIFSLCQYHTDYLFCNARYNCSLITSDDQEDKLIASFIPIDIPTEDIHHDSNHAFLWQEFSKSLIDKIKEISINKQTTTYDPKLSITIIPEKHIEVKEWGVHPIYSSDLFSFSIPLALDAKTKRYRDTDELLDMEPLPPTKKMKTDTTEET